MPTEKRIYMLGSAAQALGVSKRTVLRLIESTGLQPRRVGGRNALLFSSDMVEQLKKALTKWKKKK